MTDKFRLLYVEDDQRSRCLMKELIKGVEQKLDVTLELACSPTEEDALEKNPTVNFDAAFIDYDLIATQGDALVEKLKKSDEDYPCVMVTGKGTLELAIRMLGRGLDEYLEKPVTEKSLTLCVTRLVRLVELRRAEARQEALIAHLSKRQASEGEIVGNSREIQAVKRDIEKLASSDATVLVLGESGVGKELVARALHRSSHRSREPFIALNCGAMPEPLIESELFGHERGAFTGAERRKIGRFELAHGGTLMLDEIGEMSLSVQVKFLRVLQERFVERVGGAKPIEVDVRVVAATNQDLDEAVRCKKFRKDLLYRLRVFQISIPPIRERRKDIAPLALYFLQRYNRKYNKTIDRFSCEAMRRLKMFDWPGNVRQLDNAIQVAVFYCDGTEIQIAHLPPWMDSAASGQESPAEGTTYAEQLQAFGKKLIQEALTRNNGNQTKAATDLGLQRPRLNAMMEQLHLKRPRAGNKKNRAGNGSSPARDEPSEGSSNANPPHPSDL